MNGWCIRLAWEGTRYVGWQVQPNGVSIQSVCESALTCLLGGETVRLRAAGRTDAGVHARSQVVAFRCVTERDPKEIVGGLNRLLPEDIVCLSAEQVPADFEPRLWATGKTYEYFILQRDAPCPFRGRYSWHIRQALDLPAMRRAAEALTGRHDFSSFRAQGCSAAHAVRNILAITLVEEGDEIRIRFRGEAFVRHQVRIMVGTLVDVGLGRRSSQSMAVLLQAKDREQAGMTAPPHGLSLLQVDIGSAPRE